jgi:hypothetical protein
MDVLTERTCAECHGTGCIAEPEDCGECGGTGAVPLRRTPGGGGEIMTGYRRRSATESEARVVSFDLMPRDPDYYFVLTEALRDFADRERADAGDLQGLDAEAHMRLAETAESALDQIEAAMSAPRHETNSLAAGG